MPSYIFDDQMQELLQKEIQLELEFLAAGEAESFDDYKYRTGRIAGLQLAAEISRDIKRKYVGER